MISHELRTPLTSITGWAALLQTDPDTATIAEAARAIASSAALQAQLIDDLLDVSKIMTGKFAITEAEIDLRAVIDDTVSGMRPLGAANGVSLRTTLRQTVIIHGDAARLRQAVSNLLSNAIKFTPAGGLIEARLTCDGSFAVVEVCDTGEGISALSANCSGPFYESDCQGRFSSLLIAFRSSSWESAPTDQIAMNASRRGWAEQSYAADSSSVPPSIP